MAVRLGNREGKLRSVDSERTGRVMEPRKLCIVEADAVVLAEGSILEPRGGETATLVRIEALAERRKPPENRDSPGQGRPHRSGREDSTGV